MQGQEMETYKLSVYIPKRYLSRRPLERLRRIARSRKKSLNSWWFRRSGSTWSGRSGRRGGGSEVLLALHRSREESLPLLRA